MGESVALRCTCGTLRGFAEGVKPQTTTRVLCYCRDCRAFADFLQRPDVLDAAGGSDVFQIAQASVRFTEGEHVIACMRLSDKGMYRWYAQCCRTPIGNTLRGGVPFIGLLRVLVDLPDGPAVDGVLGSATPIQVKFAVGSTRPHDDMLATLKLIGRILPRLLVWKLTGRAFPSSFFDEHTRAPRVTPHVLDSAEREALRVRDRQRDQELATHAI